MDWHISKFQNTVKVEYLFTESTETLLTLLIFSYGKQKLEKNLRCFLAVLHQVYMRVKADSPKLMLWWKEISTNTFQLGWNIYYSKFLSEACRALNKTMRKFETRCSSNKFSTVASTSASNNFQFVRKLYSNSIFTKFWSLLLFKSFCYFSKDSNIVWVWSCLNKQ